MAVLGGLIVGFALGAVLGSGWVHGSDGAVEGGPEVTAAALEAEDVGGAAGTGEYGGAEIVVQVGEEFGHSVTLDLDALMGIDDAGKAARVTVIGPM